MPSPGEGPQGCSPRGRAGSPKSSKCPELTLKLHRQRCRWHLWLRLPGARAEPPGGEREPVSRTEAPRPPLPFGRTRATIGPRWEMPMSALLMAEQRQTNSAACMGARMLRTLFPPRLMLPLCQFLPRMKFLSSLVHSAFFFLKK